MLATALYLTLSMAGLCPTRYWKPSPNRQNGAPHISTKTFRIKWRPYQSLEKYQVTSQGIMQQPHLDNLPDAFLRTKTMMCYWNSDGRKCQPSSHLFTWYTVQIHAFHKWCLQPAYFRNMSRADKTLGIIASSLLARGSRQCFCIIRCVILTCREL